MGHQYGNQHKESLRKLQLSQRFWHNAVWLAYSSQMTNMDLFILYNDTLMTLGCDIHSYLKSIFCVKCDKMYMFEDSVVQSVFHLPVVVLPCQVVAVRSVYVGQVWASLPPHSQSHHSPLTARHPRPPTQDDCSHLIQETQTLNTSSKTMTGRVRADLQPKVRGYAAYRTPQHWQTTDVPSFFIQWL